MDLNFYGLTSETLLFESADNLQEIAQPSNTNYLSVDDVRLVPPRLTFSDAYDGKKFEMKFQIINCGTCSVFVRILAPTSNAFNLKSLPKGKYLASGMSIFRTVKFTFLSAMPVMNSYIPIYVNEKLIYYNIEVYLSAPMISLRPKIVKFGHVDVGIPSPSKRIFLENSGSKSTYFYVDLGSNDLEVIVEPRRGIIQPHSSIEISVEILGSKEGKFLKEFWVKTEPPQRVRLTGKFISSGLVVEHPISKFRITLIDFPKTYYGAETIRNIIIQNWSSQPTMFCSVAEYKGHTMSLREAREIDPNLQCFEIKPKEGRLLSKYKYVLGIHFAPTKVSEKPGMVQKYFISFIRVKKINYRDGAVREREMEVKTFPTACIELDAYALISLHSLPDISTTINICDPFVRVCLYGECEEASVSCVPDSIILENLVVGIIYHYTCNIQNHSKELPITVVYQKIACIEMEPSLIVLKPDANIDVLILIIPSKMGLVEENVVLKLIYHNEQGSYFEVGSTVIHVTYHSKCQRLKPLTPKFVTSLSPTITNEVGFLVDNVRFNSPHLPPMQTIIKKFPEIFRSDNTALIAVPNDRPRSLRPWTQQTPCKTIFAQIPRYINRQVVTLSEEVRRRSRAKSSFYLRNLSKKLPEHKTSTVVNRLLMIMDKCPDCVTAKETEDRYLDFIPLPPEKLMMIEVTPKYIELGKIAPFTLCTDYFTIENKNEFKIRISIKALNNTIIIKGKHTITINPKDRMKIFFDCYSRGLGKYYVPVYIIVNECHIFDATVFAEVVPCIVKCIVNEIEIDPKTNSAYVDIHNPVNCDINFNWEVQDSNYEINPAQGIVPARRSIYCKITYRPALSIYSKTEMYLISQTDVKQRIKVFIKNDKINVIFYPERLAFDNVPINTTITKNITVKNISEKYVSMFCVNQKIGKCLSIKPAQILLAKKSEMIFKVSIHVTSIFKFRYVLKFEIQNEYIQEIEVTGNVNCPNIEMKPEFIQIPKIPAGAFVSNKFSVTNNNLTPMRINFDLTNYETLSILDSNHICAIDQAVLESKETKNFLLNFNPLEPVVFSLFIPYIINDMIGPPKINVPQSMLIDTYLETAELNSQPSYDDSVNSDNELSTVRVRCAAGAPWFTFSSLKLVFPETPWFNFCALNLLSESEEMHDTDQTFVMKNLTSDSHRIKIITSYVKPPFHMKLRKCDGETKRKEGVLIFFLGPQEKVELIFRFCPEAVGTFEARMPIFVQNYSDRYMYNYLTLLGSGYAPIINLSSTFLALPTVPVGKKIKESIFLTIANHRDDCNIKATSDSELVVATLILKNNSSWVSITFHAVTECHVQAVIKVSCSCNVTKQLVVRACADNCSIFNFERSDDKTGAIYMDTVKQIEYWLFSQPFLCKNYHKIPDTISRFSLDVSGKDDAKKKAKLPLIQLFINLIDSSLVRQFSERSSEDNTGESEVDETLNYYQIYKKCLAFLEGNEVFVQQARPEFLMPYENYLYFKNKLSDPDFIEMKEILTEEKFYVHSKKCWTSLLMKFYKKYALDRVVDIPASYRSSDVYHNDFMAYFENNIKDFPEDYNKNEAKLALWLEFHYNLQIRTLLPPNEIKPRKIRNFGECLHDNLPSIALLLSYCPYTRPLLRDTYAESEDLILRFHNYCVARDAINRLKLLYVMEENFSNRPSELSYIMHTAYLYDVLPGFYPSEEITINANVGETAQHFLSVRNTSHTTISFKVFIFSNEHNDFFVKQNSISISPNNKEIVEITYSAKAMKKVSAYLILCGETAGYKYAKSKCYQLFGIPDIYYHVQEYVFNISLYKPFAKFISLTSPCGRNYVAQTYVYLGDRSSENLESLFVSFSRISKDMVPTQIRVDDSCLFDEEGKFQLKLNICSVCFGEKNYYLYFFNDDVGIFSVKLTLRCTLDNDIYEEIPLKIPSNFSLTAGCKCKTKTINLLCPHVLFVEIPCRNQFLMEGLKELFNYFADPLEEDFWSKHLVFPKGFPLLKTYLENTFEPFMREYDMILNPTVTYNVMLRANTAHTDKTCTINNVCESGTIKLAIHWNAKSFTQSEMLTLQASHKKEVRKYKLILPCNQISEQQ